MFLSNHWCKMNRVKTQIHIKWKYCICWQGAAEGRRVRVQLPDGLVYWKQNINNNNFCWCYWCLFPNAQRDFTLGHTPLCFRYCVSRALYVCSMQISYHTCTFLLHSNINMNEGPTHLITHISKYTQIQLRLLFITEKLDLHTHICNNNSSVIDDYNKRHSEHSCLWNDACFIVPYTSLRCFMNGNDHVKLIYCGSSINNMSIVFMWSIYSGKEVWF